MRGGVRLDSSLVVAAHKSASSLPEECTAGGASVHDGHFVGTISERWRWSEPICNPGRRSERGRSALEASRPSVRPGRDGIGGYGWGSSGALLKAAVDTDERAWSI